MKRNRPASKHAPKAFPEISNNAYMHAEKLFVAGLIPVSQAIGMILSDCDYQAECALSLRDPRLYAETIVRDLWAREMLKARAAA
jgi:hypothetical protein